MNGGRVRTAAAWAVAWGLMACMVASVSAQGEERQDAAAVEAAVEAAEAEAPGEAAMEADEPAEDAEEPAEQAPPIKVKIRPTSVNIDKSLNLDEKGQKRNEQERLSIQLHCEYSGEVGLLSYDWSEAKAITSGGTKLVSQNHSRSSLNRFGNQTTAFGLYTYFEGPIDDSNEIALLTGKLKFEIGEGPVRRAVLKPYKDLLDARISIKEMPNVNISVGKDNNNDVVVTVAGPESDMLQDISFHTAGGVQINADYRGGSSGNNRVSREYRVNMPQDGAIVLSFWKSKRQVVIPVRVTDIPLPGAAPNPDKANLVFQLEPLEGAAQAIAPGDLSVVVE